MNSTFWTHVNDYLNQARTTESIAELVAITRVYFSPERSFYADPKAAAYFPGSGGEEQLRDALADAGWRIKTIEGDYWWCSKGPLDAGRQIALEYIEGDLYIRTPEDV